MTDRVTDGARKRKFPKLATQAEIDTQSWGMAERKEQQPGWRMLAGQHGDLP